MKVKNIQELREFIKTLPENLKDEFKKNIIEERENDFFNQEDTELIFIMDNYEELKKEGWLVEN